jgi:hypothetical protein
LRRSGRHRLGSFRFAQAQPGPDAIGDDRLDGGAGGDTLDSGDGSHDKVTYENSAVGVRIEFNAVTGQFEGHTRIVE